MPKHCWTLAALWLWLWACCSTVLAAPNPSFSIRQWSSDTISPQNAVITAVIALAQTRDGYLWLGTPDGLVRFDGIHFTTFNEGNTPGLNSGGIVKLFEDSRTNLWVGTETGDVLLVKDGKVQPVRLGRGTREGRLMSICEDAHAAVWLYTADGYLGQYREAKLESWQVLPKFSSNCRAMISDTSGLLWIGTDFFLYGLRPNALPSAGSMPVTAYQRAPVGGLDYLLASQQGGYWRLANGRIQKWKGDRLENGYDWNYPWNRASTPVRAACEDPQGHLVVGTGGEGMFWFDDHGAFEQLTATNGLSSKTVLSLCLDRQGDLWVGTDGQGLNRVTRKVFQVLEESRGSTVQSVCDDGHDGLWIGYFGEQIDHWTNGVVERYGRLEGLVNLGVKSVFVDHDQNLWAGTQLGGLLRFQDKRFVRAQGSELLARNYEISALYEDHSNRLWAGSQAGLARWDGANWILVTNGIAGTVVRAIAEDRERNLWIGTQAGGLTQMREGGTRWFGKTNGLPSETISCLYLDTAGALWAGTSSGLARFAAGSWLSYEGHFSGPTGDIGYLLEDNHGYFWIGSSIGLMRARKSDLDDFAAGKLNSIPLRAYGQPDGLPTRVCSQGSQPAAFRTADGRLWFPTISGLVSLDPQKLRPNTIPPPVIIESVWVDGELQGSQTLRAPVPAVVTIPAAKESLEIHFTSINLPAPDLGLFKYRLRAHEKDWTTVEPQTRYARYTKLPHGSYFFEVKACNEDGLWNETPSSLEVTVLPPFWQTWWFMAASSICLLAAIVGSVHYVSTQKLQRQLASLRQQEALEKERARIARDLHDQLGANLTQVTLLGEMAESDKDLPAEVQAHAKQICQTARETTRSLDEIVWTVNPSNDTLDGLINYVCKYAQEYLALAGLRYRLEVPAQLPATPISPELRHNIFLAAKEAVNNVVKHSQATSAWLRLHLEPNQFTLEVEDNGRGLSAGSDNKGRNGLRNMRKRLEEIGGRFDIGPGHQGGTRVSLTAPLGRANVSAEGKIT